jgi:hypothetical protein
MTDKKISLDYANGIVYDLQKAFWDERGKGARFRTTTVGREYFTNKFLPLIKSAEIDQILQVIQDVLQEEGIAVQVTHSKEDRLLRVSVEGCVHRDVEKRLLGDDIEPFTCIPANLVVLAIEEKLGQPVELAEIKLEEGVCQLLLVLFDKPTLAD